MTFDLTNFLLSLAVAIAAAAGVTAGVDLVVLQVAPSVDTPCAVMTTYAGPEPETFSGEAATHAIQIMTMGQSPTATMALAMKLYNAFYETLEGEGGQERTPRCHWVIAGQKAEGGGWALWPMERRPTTCTGWHSSKCLGNWAWTRKTEECESPSTLKCGSNGSVNF